MGTVTIYHDNKVGNATLAGGSWDATLSLEKLRDPRPRLKARSTDTLLASTQFRISLLIPISVIGIQLISTNLSNSARYKISWYSDSGFTTLVDTTDWVDVGVTIDWSDTDDWLEWEDPDFWLGSPAFIDPDNLGRDIRVRLAASVSESYFKVEIDDQSSPDGYVEIGYVFIGEAFAPRYNFAPNANTFTRISGTTVVQAANNARYTQRRPSLKQLSLSWPVLPKAEVFGEIDDIVAIHDLDQPVYVDLDPEDASVNGQKTAFLATLTKLPANKLVDAFVDADNAASLDLEFIQVT